MRRTRGLGPGGISARIPAVSAGWPRTFATWPGYGDWLYMKETRPCVPAARYGVQIDVWGGDRYAAIDGCGVGRYSGTFEIDVNVHAVQEVEGCVRRHHEQLRVHVEAHLAVRIGDALPPEVPSNTCTIDKAVYTHTLAR